MNIIAHRANLEGPSPKTENSPDAILECIEKGFEVEIDVRCTSEGLYLGHDKPTYPVSTAFLNALSEHLWIHCKDVGAAAALRGGCHIFGHDIDDFVLTSRGVIWVYPGKPYAPHSVVVMPENYGLQAEQLLGRCLAVCTDYPVRYKGQLDAY